MRDEREYQYFIDDCDCIENKNYNMKRNYYEWDNYEYRSEYEDEMREDQECKNEPKYESEKRDYAREYGHEYEPTEDYREKKTESRRKKHDCDEPCIVIDNIVEYKSIPGPRGEPGPRGATGAAGETGAATQFRGIQAVFIAHEGGTVADGENVLFETVINNQSPNISYNTATGEFTISALGNYFASWWVNTDGAGTSTSVAFGIKANGSTAIIGSSPVVTGQVHGSALITIGTAPAALALVNVTGDTVNYAVVPIKANITLLEVTV